MAPTELAALDSVRRPGAGLGWGWGARPGGPARPAPDPAESRRGARGPSRRPRTAHRETRGGSGGTPAGQARATGADRGARLPTEGVSCFRAAACRSQAGCLRIDRLNGRDAHRHYLGLYLPRTRFARPSSPAPQSPFWLLGRYCSPLPPGRLLQRTARHQEAASVCGSNVRLGRGRFKPPVPNPQLF